MYIYSLLFFDAVIKGRCTNEIRLMVDIIAARQSYKRSEKTGIGYIRGVANSADGL